MKTGISHASYFFTRGFGRQNYFFEMLDLPTRYFDWYPRDFYEWFIHRAMYFRKTRGLDGIRMEVPRERLGDEDYIRNLRRLIEENGLYVTHYAGASLYYQHPSFVKEKIIPGVVKHMEAAERLEAKVLEIADGPPPNYWHRYRTPSLEWRMERNVQNLKPIIEMGLSYKFIMAVENHGDYRVEETLNIIKRAGGENVMVNFDTGNAVSVLEDPAKAVKKVAWKTVMTHLKDWKVMAPTYYGGRFVGVPLGQGDIDFETIFQTLQDEAPDPSNLSLNVENLILEGSEDEAVNESLRFLTEDMKRFID